MSGNTKKENYNLYRCPGVQFKGNQNVARLSRHYRVGLTFYVGIISVAPSGAERNKHLETGGKWRRIHDMCRRESACENRKSEAVGGTEYCSGQRLS